MNKVITINLGGNAYQLEEGGYDALRAYLETAAARLQGNPDRDEILSDIERAIAEKFRALLGSHKTVVEDEGGCRRPCGDGADRGGRRQGRGPGPGRRRPERRERTRGGGRRTSSGSSGPPRRLYRIHEGAMIAGVCNGIAAYLNLDPTFVRLAFVLLTIFGARVAGLSGDGVRGARGAFAGRKGGGVRRPIDGAGIHPPREGRVLRGDEGLPGPQGAPRMEAPVQAGNARERGRQWRYNWHGYWAEHAPVHPGMGFALPLLSLLHGAATILWICALISLLATGTVFGLALPANVPVWVAALLLFIAYGISRGR
jgi:phage shock protein PspC (stress-responsive transcriptional regulator)